MWGLIEEILMETALGHLNYQNLNSLQEKGRTLRGWKELVETWEVSVDTLGESVDTVSWGGVLPAYAGHKYRFSPYYGGGSFLEIETSFAKTKADPS